MLPSKIDEGMGDSNQASQENKLNFDPEVGLADKSAFTRDLVESNSLVASKLVELKGKER